MKQKTIVEQGKVTLLKHVTVMGVYIYIYNKDYIYITSQVCVNNSSSLENNVADECC